jgi:cytochrome b561
MPIDAANEPDGGLTKRRPASPAAVVRYGAVAQALHWLIAALVVVQFVLAYSASDLPLGIARLVLMARHKSVGMTILMLSVARLTWRWRNPPPPLPATMRPIEQRLAHLAHGAFYVLLLTMPLCGWLMSSAKNYSVSWFGLFTWPDLVGKSEPLFRAMRGLHDSLSFVLLTLAVLHVLAALRHQFWQKDDVLLRMLPSGKGRRQR